MFDSRRISLFCPVGMAAWFGGCVDGFFDNDSGKFFVRVCFVVGGCGSLFLVSAFLVGVGFCFSMESLILAQDERWRRA